jgi:carbamoyltransferase
MEFGPRALGNRSILADPRGAGMQSLINRKIKFRESFRPFAAAVLEREAGSYFDFREAGANPYMLIVAPVRSGKRVRVPEGAEKAERLDMLGVVRSVIPAVTHVDCSTRIQTVDAARHGLFYSLLDRFAAKTGCPLLVNTSFNVKDEPIVRTPADAVACFAATALDALAIGRFLVLRDDLPGGKGHDAIS